MIMGYAGASWARQDMRRCVWLANWRQVGLSSASASTSLRFRRKWIRNFMQGLTVWTGRMAQTGGRWYEKGVDVKIATDMVALAYAGEYDVAVLVSGDGDLAPAVHQIRRTGRRVETAMTPA